MYKLKIEIAYIQHPYIKEEGNISNWGNILLYIVNSSNSIEKVIVNTQWDVSVLLDWFLKNEKHILHEKLPTKYRTLGQSIAQDIFLFYNSEKDYEEEDYDLLFNYRKHHFIRFGMRGTDILNACIGVNESAYEVSYCTATENWIFEIDLKLFYKELKELTGR